MSDKIIGRNPVAEAVKSGREIDKIIVKKGEIEGSLRPIIKKARDAGIPVIEAERQKLDQLAEGGNHQGVIAYAAARDYASLDDIFKRAEEKGEPPFIVVLDKITDPHNFGSIIRTANCAGAHGIIIPKRGSVGLNEVVAKTSAGAIEYVPVVKVTNISQTIDTLKERGVWVAGAEAGGDTMYKTDLSGSMALVIGSEGEGISRLVKEKCDFLVEIPMFGNINSLNASVAAAVLMYEVVRRRNN